MEMGEASYWDFPINPDSDRWMTYGEAFQELGRALFGDEWTGNERYAADRMLPDPTSWVHEMAAWVGAAVKVVYPGKFSSEDQDRAVVVSNELRLMLSRIEPDCELLDEEEGVFLGVPGRYWRTRRLIVWTA